VWRGAIQRRAIEEKAMNQDLLKKLGKTKSVTLSGGVVRTLDDAELASVVGGLPRNCGCGTTTYDRNCCPNDSDA
jgi:hypothetical protein